MSPPNNAGPSTSAGSHKGLKTLQIVRGGKEVSQRSLIELKSSSTISWMDVYPQLYFGQIPYLYQGLHLRGRFTRITKRALSEEDITRRDSALEAKFCKVRNALRTIQALVIQHGHQTRLSLVYESNQGRRLEVYKRVSKASCLPQEILQRFEVSLSLNLTKVVAHTEYTTRVPRFSLSDNNVVMSAATARTSQFAVQQAYATIDQVGKACLNYITTLSTNDSITLAVFFVVLGDALHADEA